MSTISVAIVEDNRDIREGLRIMLENTPDFTLAGVYESAEKALLDIPLKKPQVVLMDIMFPSGMNGIECVKHLKDKMTELDVLMLTSYAEDDLVFQSLKAGACGYLDKNTSLPRLLEAIKEAHAGGAPMSSNIARMVVTSFNRPQKLEANLTRREQEVLEHLCEGKSYKMIADKLFITEDAIRFHIKKIYKKLEVNSKSEAIIVAMREGLIKPIR